MENLNGLNAVKRKAFNLVSLNDLKTLIAKTEYPSGDVAEIVVAFMLGQWARLYGDGLRVFMTASLDARGEDFRLMRFEISFSVQFKFNKKNTRCYPAYIRVIEEGPDRSAFHGMNYLPFTKGKYVLADVLVNSGAYEIDEAYDFMDDHLELSNICNKAWQIIKN